MPPLFEIWTFLKASFRFRNHWFCRSEHYWFGLDTRLHPKAFRCAAWTFNHLISHLNKLLVMTWVNHSPLEEPSFLLEGSRNPHAWKLFFQWVVSLGCTSCLNDGQLRVKVLDNFHYFYFMADHLIRWFEDFCCCLFVYFEEVHLGPLPCHASYAVNL